MTSDKIEFIFLKIAIEQFIKDLRKIDGLMKDKTFNDDEELEMMFYLVAVREIIEGMEGAYSKSNFV
jgi:hypothetical protein